MTEQGGSIPGLLYRGAGQAAGPTFIFAAMDAPYIWEATGSLNYVTGAHAFKIGFRNSWGTQELLERDINSATSYRFNNGVPNLITMRASPVTRSDKLNANTYYFGGNRPQGKPDKPPVTRNIFGGTIGGPIVKNRLFFFGSMEGFKAKQTINQFFNVPDARLRAGDFSQALNTNGTVQVIYDPLTGNADGTGRTPFPNNQIPANRLNPVALQ